METVFDPKQVLEAAGQGRDDAIDLGAVCVALGALDMPGVSIERYLHHLETLAKDVKADFALHLKRGGSDDVGARLAVLKGVLYQKHDYHGDNVSYDHFDNMNLLRVIDRGKGIPITLSILALFVARAQGWGAHGLNVPGHFVCRLDHAGQRVVFDPFEQYKVLEAADLRFLVKRALGDAAELDQRYFEPCSNRDILIRLQNNIKTRQIADEDYEGALQTVQRMQMVAPDEFSFLLDAGVLYAWAEQPMAAIEALKSYIEKASQIPGLANERREAQLLMDELRLKLN